MSPNELLALVALSKDLKKYSQALRITKYLVAILPDLPADIYDGYPKNELSIY